MTSLPLAWSPSSRASPSAFSSATIAPLASPSLKQMTPRSVSAVVSLARSPRALRCLQQVLGLFTRTAWRFLLRGRLAPGLPRQDAGDKKQIRPQRLECFALRASRFDPCQIERAAGAVTPNQHQVGSPLAALLGRRAVGEEEIPLSFRPAQPLQKSRHATADVLPSANRRRGGRAHVLLDRRLGMGDIPDAVPVLEAGIAIAGEPQYKAAYRPALVPEGSLRGKQSLASQVSSFHTAVKPEARRGFGTRRTRSHKRQGAPALRSTIYSPP